MVRVKQLLQLSKSAGVESLVKALCFDTTASNSDRQSVACGVIETRLCKNLLHLACRQHVYESVV